MARLSDHERHIDDGWHWCRYSPDATRAHDALHYVIRAALWCEEHVDPRGWERMGNNFYFKQEEDLVRFQLTWL